MDDKLHHIYIYIYLNYDTLSLTIHGDSELASVTLIPLHARAWAHHSQAFTKMCEYGATKCSSAYFIAPSRIEIAIPLFGRFKAARVHMCEYAHLYVNGKMLLCSGKEQQV